jgi:hypothetical protein
MTPADSGVPARCRIDYESRCPHERNMSAIKTGSRWEYTHSRSKRMKGAWAQEAGDGRRAFEIGLQDLAAGPIPDLA